MVVSSEHVHNIQVDPRKKTIWNEARFLVFMAVKILLKVLGVLMLYSVVVGYQCFGGPHCLYLQVSQPRRA
jgi:hypothetical protein